MGFPPILSLLVPAYALAHAPAVLPVRLRRRGQRSPTILTNPRLRRDTWVPVIFGAGWLDR